MNRAALLVLAASLLLIAASTQAAFFVEEVTLEKVDAELEANKTPHLWAGYYNGPGGFSVGFIHIAPSGKYCAAMEYDMGPTTVSKCGRLRLDGGRLVTDGSPQPWERTDLDAPPYDLVNWGARRYLIPERNMLDFVNAVNSVHEPAMGGLFGGSHAAFLRAGDQKILVSGLPDLPEPYRALLRPRNIFTTAVSISTRTNIVTRIGSIEEEDCGAKATFTLGASSGAFAGMELYAQSGDVQASVVLASVTTNSSSGRIKQDDCDKTDPLLTGTVFATRPRWNANIVLSTDPVTVEIERVSDKKATPFFEGPVFEFYEGPTFAGAAETGFKIEMIARLTFTSTIPGGLRTDEALDLKERAVLSVGGNAIASPLGDGSRKEEETGGVETLSLPVYRVSFEGHPLEPSSPFWWTLKHLPRHRGEEWKFNWRQARDIGVKADKCDAASRNALRAGALEALRWDETTLSRAYKLKFADLNPEQRAAAETLVPEGHRDRYVWPALHDWRNKIHYSAGSAARDSQRAFAAAHPKEAADCARWMTEAEDIRFRRD